MQKAFPVSCGETEALPQGDTTSVVLQTTEGLQLNWLLSKVPDFRRKKGASSLMSKERGDKELLHTRDTGGKMAFQGYQQSSVPGRAFSLPVTGMQNFVFSSS